MITKQDNLNVVNQIALLFFPTDEINRAVLYERLKNYLNDDLFQTILGQLSNGRFYAFQIVSIIPDSRTTFSVKNNFFDLFFGSTGSGEIKSCTPKQVGNKQQLYQKANLIYLGSITVNNIVYDIIQNINVNGYGVTYNPNILPGGSGGSGTPGGSGGSGGGSNITIDPVRSENTNNIPAGVIQSTNQAGLFNGLDLNSLIIPGILIGLFLYLKK